MQDAVALLRQDLPAIVVSTVLLTITAVMLLFVLSGRWRENRQILIAASFATCII